MAASRDRFIGLLLGMTLTPAAVGECLATGYRTGEPIPAYVVLGHRTLEDDWSRYQARYGESAQLTHAPSAALAVRPLLEQCLVVFAPVDARGRVEESGWQQLILQRPCREFRPGDVRRLVVYAYCIELFRQDPDFYSTLPYRHANTTTRKRY